jgi:hypothetical protein
MNRCPWCGSYDNQAGLDELTCLSCGNNFTFTGEKVPSFPIPSNPDEIEALARREWERNQESNAGS